MTAEFAHISGSISTAAAAGAYQFTVVGKTDYIGRAEIDLNNYLKDKLI